MYEKELLKIEHGQIVYNKSIDLAELLGLEEDVYNDFTELIREIVLNIIIERQIHIDILRSELEEAFSDVPIELSRKQWKNAMKRMGINKILGNL